MTTQDRTTIGPYRLLRPIAEGGMARLYLARKETAGGFSMDCVVKTIHPGFASDKRYIDLFLREARISASLRHQNIVQIYDFDREEDGTLYLSMEYVQGRDLRVVMERAKALGKPIAPEVALRIGLEVLKGLDHAHKRTDNKGRSLGIVHRDLTPNNILLSTEGEVKIADFGIAKAAFAETVDAGALKGKFHYMSPEQIDGKTVDPRSDLYALGVVLYEMIVGKKPFEGDNITTLIADVLKGRYTPASELVEIPSALDSLFDKALAKSPGGRFASAAEMIDQIEKIIEFLPIVERFPIRAFYSSLFGEIDTVDKNITPPELVDATRTGILAKKKINKGRKTVIFILVLLAAAAIAYALFHDAISPENLGTPTPVVQITPPTPSPTPVPIPSPTPESTPESTPTPAPTPSPTPAPSTPAPIAEPGYLVVGDLAPFAQVYVDGKYFDDTPTKKLKLPAGKHMLTLSNPKIDQTKTFAITIKPGQTTPISDWP